MRVKPLLVKVASLRSSKAVYWGLKIFFCISLLAWVVAPYLMLELLSPSWASKLPLLNLQERLDSLEEWEQLISMWACSFIVISLFMLLQIIRVKNEDAQITQFLLSLICTLTLGVPSILFGTLPIIAGNIDSLQQLYPQAPPLNISGDDPKNTSYISMPDDSRGVLLKPVEYVIALDVSRSFLPADNKERSTHIASTIENLFGESGIFRDSLQDQDCFTVITFAGNPKIWRMDQQDSGNGRCKRSSRDELLEALMGVIGTRPPIGKDELGTTDLLAAFGQAYEYLEGRQDSYSSARLIVLSDFLHSTGHAEQKLEEVQLNPDTRNLTRRLEALHDFSMVAFHGPSLLHTQADQGIDLRPYLKRSLKEKWQELSINDFLKADKTTMTLLPTNLYTRVEAAHTLYLKYLKTQDYEFIPSRLRVPDGKGTDEIFFGLYSEVHPDVGGPESMRIKVARGTDDEFVLGLDDQDKRCGVWNRKESSDNPVSVEIDSRPDGINQQGHYLLVSIPSRATLYKIRLVLLEVQDKQYVISNQ